MQEPTKEGAAVYGEKSDGTKVLRGHAAVDPSGHLVLLPKDTDLPDPGWRWADADDTARAGKLEADRKAAESAEPASGGPLK